MSKTNQFEEIKNKTSLMLIVHTNAVKTEIKSYDEHKKVYCINVAAPPQDNKANIELMKYFSKNFGKRIRIISGVTAKKKLIRLI